MGGGEPFTSYWNRCGLLLDTRVFPSNTAYLILLLSSPRTRWFTQALGWKNHFMKTFKAFSGSLGLETLRVGGVGGHIFFSFSEKYSFFQFFPLGIWSFIFRVLQTAPHTHTLCCSTLPGYRVWRASFVVRAADWLKELRSRHPGARQ